MSNLPLNQKPSNDDKVNDYFAGYYNKNVTVAGTVYDVVLTFFLGRTRGDRTAAEALTSSVMVLAQGRGIDPVGLIEDFKKIKDDQSFKAALVALLNSDRRPTSKLGYANIPEPDPYVTRNVHS